MLALGYNEYGEQFVVFLTKFSQPFSHTRRGYRLRSDPTHGP
jgi:hypothetical protein